MIFIQVRDRSAIRHPSQQRDGWHPVSTDVSPDVDEAWHALNAERKKGRTYSLSSQAVAMGFSSYARFSRACLVAYGKTPGEIEYEVLSECVRETLRAGETAAGDARPAAGAEAEPTLVELKNEFEQRWPMDPWRRADAVRDAG